MKNKPAEIVLTSASLRVQPLSIDAPAPRSWLTPRPNDSPASSDATKPYMLVAAPTGVAPLIEKSGDIAAMAVGTATEAMSATEKSQQEMSSAVEGLNQTMEKIQDKAQQAASGGKKKKGSVSRRRRRNTVKQQKAAAKRTMKRIKKSMRRFFRTGAKTKTKRRGRA